WEPRHRLHPVVGDRRPPWRGGAAAARRRGGDRLAAGCAGRGVPAGRRQRPGGPSLPVEEGRVSDTPDLRDLLVVGAGPTAIAIGAEARQAGLAVLLVDRGPLTAAIQQYPIFMEFFTTRDRLEIAGVPFTIAEDKPTRRQALAYYRFVVERYQVPLALYEDVL